MKRARCLKCNEELDIDDLIECSSCTTIMRLVCWEPLTLQVVEDAESAQSNEKDEGQLRYEAEMAKISYRDLASGYAKVSEVDISKPAYALRFLRLMDYLLVISCSLVLLRNLSALIYTPEIKIGLPLFFSVVIIAILLLGVYTGYRHIGVIDERVWRAYIAILPILLLLYIFTIAVNLSIIFKSSGAKGQADVILIRLYSPLYFSFHAVLAVLGIVSGLRLRRMQIARLGISLSDLLSTIRSYRGIDSPTVQRVNKPLGIFIGGVGVVILLGGVFIPTIFDDLTTVILSWEILTVIYALGLSLLMIARRYFQVNAYSLLSVDKRSPILFLRSFDDDEKQTYRNISKQLLDYSLETRLLNHFSYFGPFIAVGLPNETVPVPGAARVTLSHDEWLPRVARWMSEAELIVMYSGKTNWVNWELAKIIEAGRVPNLILMIPEIKGGDQKTRSEDISARIERLRDIFKNTRWSNSLADLQSFHDIRAMLFGDNGSLVVIKSRPRNRDSYHLAALVVHYIILNQAVPELLYTAQAVRSQSRK